MYESEDLRAYRKGRASFSLKAYGILFLWLIMALVQWLVVCLIEDARHIFRKYYYICLVTFAVAILLFALFIFVESLRFLQALNFIVALIIVELMIISTFALVVLSWWGEVLTFYIVSVVLVLIFLIVGLSLPRRMDLTLDIAILFIVAFIFLIIATFVLIFELTIRHTAPYGYLTVELCITFTILLFVMYHGQTIHGNRFAEMRLNDYFLASLILFHDFLIIYWLTFYWQIRYRPITANAWINTSTPYPYYSTSSNYSNAGWEYWNLRKHLSHESLEGEWTGEPHPEEDVTSQVHEARDRPRDRGRDKYWITASPRPTRRGFPREWFAQKGNEEDDRAVYKVPRPGQGPMADGVLYKAQPFDDRNAPMPEDEAGERYNDEPRPRSQDDGSGSGYGGDATGKLEAGGPSIDFPLADQQPKLDPASKESMVGLVEMSPPKHTLKVNTLIKNHKNYQLSEHEKTVRESKTKAKEPNFLGDEMKGLDKKDEGVSPDWEVLSQDELKKLTNSEILKSKVIERIHPRVRAPYRRKSLSSSDHAKLVIDDSSKVLK